LSQEDAEVAIKKLYETCKSAQNAREIVAGFFCSSIQSEKLKLCVKWKKYPETPVGPINQTMALSK